LRGSRLSLRGGPPCSSHDHGAFGDSSAPSRHGPVVASGNNIGVGSKTHQSSRRRTHVV
jgi:hypothetical protein